MRSATTLPAPLLITFDIFGTVLDWRAGLGSACAAAGRPLGRGEFDRVIDRQGQLEHGEFRTYAEITRRSLVEMLGMDDAAARAIGAGVGLWPLYPDSREALRALMELAPCAALTNSDRAHGEQMQTQLGFRLSDWLCAEEARVYKPDPAFWSAMARRRGIEPGPRWWHVSAYADYDLAVANRLGLTTVFVERPHARRGPATHTVRDLLALAGATEAT
jgi:2-haloacid dehalogenase